MGRTDSPDCCLRFVVRCVIMYTCPPKKKLRQTSITEMLKKPLSQEEEKKKHTSSSSMERGGHVKMKPAGTSSTQGGKSVRGKERSVEMRDVLANAAEQRIQSAGSQSVKKTMMGTITNNTEDREWRGVPLSSLPCLSADNLNVPDVVPSPDHAVLVRLPVSPGTVPLPHPSSHSDTWDQCHVRMPCSPKSQYPKNKDMVVPRWSVITEALSRKINSVEDLERAVLEYNSRYISKWKFRGLHHLLEQEFEEEERACFFNKTLPVMVQLALSLPDLVTRPPPLLLQGTTHSVTLSQMQIASLLANAFFCTFPRRNAKGNDTEYARYPDINFNRLFFHKEQRSLEKIKCLLHYFQRVTTKPPTGTVTFTRQAVLPRDVPKWEASRQSLPSLHVSSAGLIEEATGLLQVDFANKYLGGGVLGLGCVQEEIRFVLCPELIISRLFTQVLDKTDALIITGCEQFSRASGYSSSFRWEGPHEDKTPMDQWGRRLCQVTAIDALHFTKQPNIQYEPFYVNRELNKAYAGFKVIEGSGGIPTGVATGNWGCGAFKGNPRLKALIQLAVCGHIGRDLAYFTFGDQQLRDDLFTMYIFLKENNVTVGELTQALNHHGYRGWSDGSDLFQYVCHSLGGSYDSDTDQELSKDSADVRVKATPDVKEAEDAAGHPPEPSQTKKPPTDIANCFPEPGRTTRCPLSEEKILQVLSECDRIFENEKAKKKQGAGPTSDDSSHKTETQRKMEEQESEPRRADKTTHSTSDSNRLSESPRKGEDQKSELRRPDKQAQSSDSNRLSESPRKAEEQKSEFRRADKAAQNTSESSKLFRLLDEYDRQMGQAPHSTSASEPRRRFSLLEGAHRKLN
ncbi:hypothetical protein O3P69_016390 [Scylla paramamosain]|uniref:poly(ADP-ribose) glycohydrolase n=2 Tax=Scylla paramamosain TaxID=85552 RepID=A0AAW0TG29_SCYPA